MSEARLLLRCACGELQGAVERVSPAGVTRCVCYCRDCQAFAHELGRADDVLDAAGGTEVLQMQPARLRFDRGAEQLACLQLSPRGPFRWYVACCQTPVGNTLRAAWVPFVGLIRTLVHPEQGVSLDDVVGPVAAQVYQKGATGPVPHLQGAGGHGIITLKFLRLLAIGVLRRGGRTPFFDPQGQPAAPPRVLTPEERGRLP